MKAFAKWLICGCSGIALVLIGVLIEEWIVPVYLEYQIGQKILLTNGSLTWDNFIETPLPLTFNIYIFNVVNENEVKNGGKPNMSQVGPYVYNAYMKKHNLVINSENGTVTYDQGYTFEFDEEATKPLSEDDIVHPINLISHMMFLAFSRLGPGLSSSVEMLDSVLPEILEDNNGFLLNVTVRKLLFDGILLRCNNTEASLGARLLCSVIEHLSPKNIGKTSDGNFLISLFDFKNTTTVGPMEINSGISNIRNVGKIVSFQKASKLEYWSGDVCNDLTNSYDISVLPPFLTRSSGIRIFISDAGAPIQFVYDSDADYETVPGYRFIASSDFLGEVTNYPDMYCFCPNRTTGGLTLSDGCLRAGTLDLSPVLTVPAILSLPHFYMASSFYQNGVIGMSPDSTKHSSFFLVEPYTGTPLEAAARIQINVQMMKSSALSMFQNLTSTLVPVVWFDEGVQVGDDVIQILQNNLLVLLNASKIVLWVCVSVGSLLAIVGAIGLWISLRWKSGSNWWRHLKMKYGQEKTSSNHQSND